MKIVSMDYDELRKRVSYCDSHHHGDCHSIDPGKFIHEITLVDLKNQKLLICQRKERYAALSYVWGDSSDAFETLKSNRANLAENNGLIDHWDKLPATIRDVAFICKILDIPSLWVDRLCIVQDDVGSKNHNLSWMASIYANSYLTIVAAQGTDANSGIHRLKTNSGPQAWPDFIFDFNNVVCVRAHEEQDGQWHTRDWKFQERVLSRRALVFHGETVTWECQNIRFIENVSEPPE
jgi:hypothetical protein